MAGADPLVSRIAAAARREPGAPAVADGGRVTTRADLARRVSDQAEAIRAHGCVGEVVAVAAPRGLVGITGLLAVLAAGCTYLPLDPAQPPARRDEVLADSRAALLLDDSGQLHPLVSPTSRSVWAGNAGGRDVPAYLVYTSGSTGRPKGILMGRRAIDGLVAWHVAQRSEDGRRTAQFAAMGFDVAVQEVLATLAAGGCLVPVHDADRRDPERLVDQLVRDQVHRIFVPTAALQRICEAGSPRALKLALDEVVCAGEQLQVTTAVRDFFARTGARLWNHYGPAETHVVTALPLPPEPAGWSDRPGIGLPLPDVHLLVDAGLAEGDVLPHDEDLAGDDGPAVGELLVGGPRVAQGYLDRAEETAARFSEVDGVPWYRTGDLVRREAAGWTYLGRVDGQLKVSGHRVEPAEVEECLLGHPDVAECAVDLAPSDPARGRPAALRAHVSLRRPRPSDDLRRELRQLCLARLPAHLAVKDVVVLTALPLTVNGKVDRQALAGGVPAGPEPVLASSPDRSTAAHVVRDHDVAELLSGLVADQLGLASVDVDENFFDLGATSLAIAELRDRITSLLDRPVAITLLYAEPTVARLTTALSTSGPATSPRGGRSDSQPGSAQPRTERSLSGPDPRAARREQRRQGRST